MASTLLSDLPSQQQDAPNASHRPVAFGGYACHHCGCAAEGDFSGIKDMLARLKTYTLLGIEAMPVDVEVDISPAAMPKTILVGLPDTAVKESTHRVERAIVNSGFTRPIDRIVINLAPGDLPKQAASFDLSVALGVLAGSGQLIPDRLENYAIIGELALEGYTRPVKGCLSIAIEAAKAEGLAGLVLPAANAAEAAVVEGLDVIPVESLAQAVAFFAGEIDLAPAPSRLEALFEEHSAYEIDFGDVRGQESAKRAITLAAAGSHNLIMIGPPGSGKTMLAKRVPTVLPTLSAPESIETTRIYSALGQLPSGQPLLARRPFRSPHHTISDAGLVGGGSPPSPGEISKAHNGILFLDELPEFNRKTLEVMRQPLEDGVVTISRALRSTSFPSDFMLIAAANPCPCGYRSDPRRACNCTPPQVEKYMSRISGPLMDRIDIQIEVPAVPFEELSGSGNVTGGTTSAQMREAVEQARKRQAARFSGDRTGVRYNAQMTSRQVRECCKLDSTCSDMLRHSVEEMGLSARAHDKILRVCRTIADVSGEDKISEIHLAEAINYRNLDRDLWV
ncbi:YifB family Mg chelatase-like AAA ATPase [Roseiconus lacunae]|uniref:YifB family Mg chelatase-like AAA ATPase n=1 Tax=Roseiconus lacunae TaxID=2605694 RepID=A0ABT7PBD0_9BACT|nr:YifB family Mg chelatase-like AAA ATPase [Roseiconus lacunae]MDM4013805.1 YifB family Mg chelatase-like AAA ATPase [Roseiconus lacunae]